MTPYLAILVTGFLATFCHLCDGISSEEEYPVPKQSIMPGFTPHFAETFNDQDDFAKTWVKSEAKKDGVDGDIARYDGDWELDYPRKLPIDGDMGLVFKQKAKHRAISSKLNRPFVFTDKPLYLQYEVLFQDTQECGGAYLKLLSEGPESSDLKLFHDKTPYTIMFGPDKCGNIHHLHFIFRHKNPINGSFEEKHSKGPSKRIDELFTDGIPHLYTLIILPDNTYQILVDHEVTVKGSLLEDFNPPVNPPAEIDDPSDHKPEDWDEREKIPDETATKPDDWDETAPPMIPDPNPVKPDSWLESEPVDITDPSAEKPDDWDDAMDGEWEAPMVPNPACEDAAGCGPWSPPMIDNPAFKGKWSPPLIDNPNYKGKWHPKKIPNPYFFEDKNPFRMTTVTALGLELWSMTANIMFDNFVITDNEEFLREWTAATYEKKMAINNKNADTLWTRIMIQINYKPGWWALYFLYCAIPIGGYVYYLYRRVKEEGTLMSKFLQVTNAHPWLWVVVTLLPLIPIVFIAYYCLRTKEQEGQGAREGLLTDQPDQESVARSQFGDGEEDEDEEGRGDDEEDDRADELENERNETMDGIPSFGSNELAEDLEMLDFDSFEIESDSDNYIEDDDDQLGDNLNVNSMSEESSGTGETSDSSPSSGWSNATYIVNSPSGFVRNMSPISPGPSHLGARARVQGSEGEPSFYEPDPTASPDWRNTTYTVNSPCEFVRNMPDISPGPCHLTARARVQEPEGEDLPSASQPDPTTASPQTPSRSKSQLDDDSNLATPLTRPSLNLSGPSHCESCPPLAPVRSAVRQRWVPSTSSEQENLVNEQLDDRSGDAPEKAEPRAKAD